MDEELFRELVDRLDHADPDEKVSMTRAQFDHLADLASGARMAALGDEFREGESLRGDMQAAFHCYQLAADLGDPDGMNNLGSMYLNGIRGRRVFGPPQEPDMAAARRWYEAAARRGHSVAQYNLGKLYLHGNGVEVDYAIAAHWIGQAALQGYIEAVCDYGTMHRFGQGVDADLVRAAHFHVIAATQEDATAHGNLCDYRDELFDLALNGDAGASYLLSRMFREGLGVEVSEALAWALVRWGKECCEDHGEYKDVLEELALEFVDAITQEERDRGDRQFEEWSNIFCSASSQCEGTKSVDHPKNLVS